MNYLTNYYKNLSEELQTKINLLEMMIAQSAPPPPPPPPPSQPSPFAPPPPSPPQQNNPAPGAPPSQGPVWDPDNDGHPNNPPTPTFPKYDPKKWDSPEEYQRDRFNWEEERRAYQRYLEELRKFNRQRQRDRERRRP